MYKKFLALLLFLSVVASPAAASATAEEIPMTEYVLEDDNMSVDLPDGWYFNTPEQIDKDFLEVTENKERKLEKFLRESGISYNLVSKDLKEEINVIMVSTSQTKTMFNFNLLDKEVLENRAQVLIAQGTQEDDSGKTTYTSYEVRTIGDCTFTILSGNMERKEGNADFIQYTTAVNGYGITFSYRAYEGADTEKGKILMENIVSTLAIKVIEDADVKTQFIKQVIPYALLVLGVVGFTVFMFIKQLRKNK